MGYILYGSNIAAPAAYSTGTTIGCRGVKLISIFHCEAMTSMFDFIGRIAFQSIKGGTEWQWNSIRYGNGLEIIIYLITSKYYWRKVHEWGEVSGISMGLMWACFRVWYPNGLIFFTISVSVLVQIFRLVSTPLPTSRGRPPPPLPCCLQTMSWMNIEILLQRDTKTSGWLISNFWLHI